MDYTSIILVKYPGAVAFPPENANFRLEIGPDPIMMTGIFDEDGNFISSDNSNVPTITRITQWNLPDPLPTIAELEAYAASPEYLAAHLAKLKTEAVTTLNAWRGERRKALGLTMADFQELVYSGKMMQAQRWIDDPTQRFYFVQESAARGISHFEMAQIIIGQGEAWLLASDVIEAGYITIKAAIEAASNESEIAGILAALTWP